MADIVLLDYTGRPVETCPSDIVLMFNEENVWCPLIGRDYRDRDPMLAQLVAPYGSKDPFLELAEEEASIY